MILRKRILATAVKAIANNLSQVHVVRDQIHLLPLTGTRGQGSDTPPTSHRYTLSGGDQIHLLPLPGTRGQGSDTPPTSHRYTWSLAKYISVLSQVHMLMDLCSWI